MTRTLACLVASMTVGAVFLNWMKPVDPTNLTASIELMARGPAVTAWQGIEVQLCGPGDQADSNSHILIDSNGDLQETEHWYNQKPLDAKATIRIGLVAADGPETVTLMQRRKAMAISRHLCDRYGITSAAHIP